jgi:hypothetical protein
MYYEYDRQDGTTDPLEDDHYADDGYDGLVHDDEWHLDPYTGEWCHCSSKELIEKELIVKELAPFYLVAKWSLAVGLLFQLGMFLYMLLS